MGMQRETESQRPLSDPYPGMCISRVPGVLPPVPGGCPGMEAPQERNVPGPVEAPGGSSVVPNAPTIE
eukprot:2698241-Rhodomonas_salina.2